MVPHQVRVLSPAQMQLGNKARSVAKLKLPPTVLLETAKKNDASLTWVKLINLNTVLNARHTSVGKANLYVDGCYLSGYYENITFSHEGKGAAPQIGVEMEPFDNAKAFLVTFYVFTMVPSTIQWFTMQGGNLSTRVTAPFNTKPGIYEAITVPVVKTDPNSAYLQVGLTCASKDSVGFFLDRVEIAALH